MNVWSLNNGILVSLEVDSDVLTVLLSDIAAMTCHSAPHPYSVALLVVFISMG